MQNIRGRITYICQLGRVNLIYIYIYVVLFRYFAWDSDMFDSYWFYDGVNECVYRCVHPPGVQSPDRKWRET